MSLCLICSMIASESWRYFMELKFVSKTLV
jgi:hypothetical protein